MVKEPIHMWDGMAWLKAWGEDDLLDPYGGKEERAVYAAKYPRMQGNDANGDAAKAEEVWLQFWHCSSMCMKRWVCVLAVESRRRPWLVSCCVLTCKISSASATPTSPALGCACH